MTTQAAIAAVKARRIEVIAAVVTAHFGRSARLVAESAEARDALAAAAAEMARERGIDSSLIVIEAPTVRHAH